MTELSRPELVTDQDIALTLFEAQMALNDEMVDKICYFMQVVNDARENGLKVDIYRDQDGEITYLVRKRGKIGFPHD